MNISQQIASNIVKTNYDSLNEVTIERVKWRILDAIGCLIAGANAPGCHEMLAIVKQWGGNDESTILAHGGKVPSPNAAMINSLMTRSFDFEPVEAEGENTSSPAHISGTTIPTALAVAESRGVSGQFLITALVLGDDLASRLGVASGFEFDLGWDNTGTINAFGATAIAGKLLELDENQVHQSFGIVLNQLSGSMSGVFDKTTSFKLPISLSARNGILAANLAKQGFYGVKDPFLGNHGFFSLYCRKSNTSRLIKDLGNIFYADCVIKPYSACRATHSSIDSALKISQNNYIDTDKIKEIEVHLSQGTFDGFCGQPFIIGDTPQVDAAFSIRYTVACALLRKGIMPEYFTVESITSKEIKHIIDKIILIPGIPLETRSRTEINVRMRDGKVFSASTDIPKGDIYKSPLTIEEIKAKYRSNIAFSQTVSERNSEKAMNIIEHLEELSDIRELTQLLVK
jgi:2-methylcitrate dehydratase PrpD